MTKSKRVFVRVTEEELATIDRLAKNHGVNRSQYILYLIEREAKGQAAGGEDVIVFHDADMRKINWHLQHIGTNLNQAANAINYFKWQDRALDARLVKALEETGQRVDEADSTLLMLLKAFRDVWHERKYVVTKD